MFPFVYMYKFGLYGNGDVPVYAWRVCMYTHAVYVHMGTYATKCMYIPNALAFAHVMTQAGTFGGRQHVWREKESLQRNDRHLRGALL
jgi:hypothetical protein